MSSADLMTSNMAVMIGPILCLLGLISVMPCWGQIDSSAEQRNCRHVITQIAIEPSLLRLRQVCQSNFIKYTLVIRSGQSQWRHDVIGRCSNNNYGGNIVSVSMSLPLSSNSSILQLIMMVKGAVIDAGHVTTGTSLRHQVNQVIFATGNHNSRFTVTFEQPCFWPGFFVTSEKQPFKRGQQTNNRLLSSIVRLLLNNQHLIDLAVEYLAHLKKHRGIPFNTHGDYNNSHRNRREIDFFNDFGRKLGKTPGNNVMEQTTLYTSEKVDASQSSITEVGLSSDSQLPKDRLLTSSMSFTQRDDSIGYHSLTSSGQHAESLTLARSRSVAVNKQNSRQSIVSNTFLSSPKRTVGTTISSQTYSHNGNLSRVSLVPPLQMTSSRIHSPLRSFNHIMTRVSNKGPTDVFISISPTSYVFFSSTTNPYNSIASFTHSLDHWNAPGNDTGDRSVYKSAVVSITPTITGSRTLKPTNFVVSKTLNEEIEHGKDPFLDVLKLSITLSSDVETSESFLNGSRYHEKSDQMFASEVFQEDNSVYNRIPTPSVIPVQSRESFTSLTPSFHSSSISMKSKMVSSRKIDSNSLETTLSSTKRFSFSSHNHTFPVLSVSTRNSMMNNLSSVIDSTPAMKQTSTSDVTSSSWHSSVQIPPSVKSYSLPSSQNTLPNSNTLFSLADKASTLTSGNTLAIVPTSSISTASFTSSTLSPSSPSSSTVEKSVTTSWMKTPTLVLASSSFTQSSDSSQTSSTLSSKSGSISNNVFSTSLPVPDVDPDDKDDDGSSDTLWPVIAALVVGIPAVIVFGIAIVVIHRRRLEQPSTATVTDLTL